MVKRTKVFPFPRPTQPEYHKHLTWQKEKNRKTRNLRLSHSTTLGGTSNSGCRVGGGALDSHRRRRCYGLDGGVKNGHGSLCGGLL